MSVNAMIRDAEAAVLKAGAYALQCQSDVMVQYKDDGSALTQVDLAVSRMIAEMLAVWLEQQGHVLVDEEFIKRTPDDIFGAYEYIWVLDPIDGTAGYAAGRKMWGISLGLLHNGKPVGGVIYLPVLGELLVTYPEGALRIDTVTHKPYVRLEGAAMKITSQTFVETYFGGDTRWGKTFAEGKVWINRPESAVQGFFSVLTNGAVAGTLVAGYSLWDVAAAVALARQTGHKVLSMEDGREWETMTADDFTPRWKLAGDWLMVRPEYYQQVRDALVG